MHCISPCPAVLCCAAVVHIVQGVPTVEAVSQALQELGPIPTSQITLLNEHLDAVRVGEEGKKLLKSRILQVRGLGWAEGVGGKGCGVCCCVHARPQTALALLVAGWHGDTESLCACLLSGHG